MTQPNSNLSSTLSRFSNLMRDPDPDGAWKFAQELWQKHGIVVFVLSDVDRKRGWSAAKNARNLAENCYGKAGAVK